MSAFIIAPDARDDLDAIWDYYGLELQNPDAADHVLDDLFAAMRLLTKSPGIGHFRSDLSKEPLRFWHVRSYLIIYRSEMNADPDRSCATRCAGRGNHLATGVTRASDVDRMGNSGLGGGRK